MELNAIVDSLDNKSIFVTGATGFLAKIFVEKILRVQPNVKQLFLLLRAPDAQSATQRLHSEVMGKEVFRVLKTKYGVKFDSFIREKVTPLAGDIALEHFGLRDDSELWETMLKEVDVVVSFAATTNFYERYDVALGVNTMGAKHVLDFAKKCENLEMLLHVSTAYVCGEESGVVLEKPFCMGETLNGTSEVLDIETELKLVQQLQNELKVEQVSKKEETDAMKSFGLQRAQRFGWPNTYVFTKAMGEMLLGKFREDVPLVIIRPTIVTSTYKEPFPGWTEGVRTIDSFIVAYAKGKLPCYLGNTETIFDLIPGDMVVNAIIVGMVVNANMSSPDKPFIYQLCSSSTTEPFNCNKLRDYGYNYFSKNPLIDKDGKSIKIVKPLSFPTMATFRRHIFLNYMLPLKGFKLVNAVFCQYFRVTYNDMERKINQIMRMVELNEPYIFFKGRFDESNTRRLRMAMRVNEAEASTFYFDSKCIDWEDYFVNIHFPGLVKYVIKM